MSDIFLLADDPRPGLENRMPKHDSEPRSRPEIGVEELSEDMTRGDIVAALQYLRFPNGTGLVAMDRPVRDFIVSALRRR